MSRVDLRFPTDAVRLELRAIVSDYLSLTKPRIAWLIVVSAYAGMWLAQGGLPPCAPTFFTLGALALAIGGSHTLNMVYDRDIDALMERTRRRPLPAGRITPRQAVDFAVLQFAGSLALLTQTNWLTAALTAAGALGYVVLYTMLSKRKSRYSTVLGAIPGAIPALLGWTAITGAVAWPAVWLFAIVFFWQPPHVWALALYRRDDFRAIGLPLVPLVAGEASTRRQTFVHAALTLVAIWALTASGSAHLPFAGLATAASLAYWAVIVRSLRQATTAAYRRWFKASALYLALVFLMLIADAAWG